MAVPLGVPLMAQRNLVITCIYCIHYNHICFVQNTGYWIHCNSTQIFAQGGLWIRLGLSACHTQGGAVLVAVLLSWLLENLKKVPYQMMKLLWADRLPSPSLPLLLQTAGQCAALCLQFWEGMQEGAPSSCPWLCSPSVSCPLEKGTSDVCLAALCCCPL